MAINTPNIAILPKINPKITKIKTKNIFKCIILLKEYMLINEVKE